MCMAPPSTPSCHRRSSPAPRTARTVRLRGGSTNARRADTCIPQLEASAKSLVSEINKRLADSGVSAKTEEGGLKVTVSIDKEHVMSLDFKELPCNKTLIDVLMVYFLSRVAYVIDPGANDADRLQTSQTLMKEKVALLRQCVDKTSSTSS